ncbi:DNA-binding protein [Candidatus Micrarchaeota archaeon]|nr:DNA-binding protein [Candidatus Micrarchaeota archaeon]
MDIKDLKPGTVTVVRGVVISKGETREVLNRFGKRMKVANVTLKDESGEITLSLWGDDIDKVKVGDKITIKDGWVSTFRNNLQLSLGRNGKLIVERD